MKTILAWTLAGILAAAILMTATAYNNDAAARRYQAAAMIVREQSQARLDLATALMPYTVLGVIVIVALAITGLIVYALARGGRQQPATTRIIESRTVILLQPGQSRRQLYRLLSGGNDDEIL